MKHTNTLKCAAFCLAVLPILSALGIEGLRISVPCPDVMLSWPSADGETYLVQYRPTLDTNSSWTTLTNYMPNDYGTDWTTFVHSNQAQCASSQSLALSRTADVAAASQTFSAPLVEAVLSGQTFYPLPPTPMPPVRTNGVWVPWEQVYGPHPPVMGRIPDAIRQRILAADSLGTLRVLDTASTTGLRAASSLRSGGTIPDGPSPNDGGQTLSPTGFYRVVRDGVHFYGLTNGTVLSGLVTIPVEYSVTSTDQIAGLTFYADGSPLLGAVQLGNAMRWDTTMMPNGTYAISAELDFCGDPPVAGTAVTVTVDNVISFPNYFSCVYGSQMWIYAQTIPYAEYQIDMYDQDSSYLGYFWGYTDDNGVISFLWNLTDGHGHTFDSTNFTGVFTVDTSSLWP